MLMLMLSSFVFAGVSNAWSRPSQGCSEHPGCTKYYVENYDGTDGHWIHVNSKGEIGHNMKGVYCADHNAHEFPGVDKDGIVVARVTIDGNDVTVTGISESGGGQANDVTNAAALAWVLSNDSDWNQQPALRPSKYAAWWFWTGFFNDAISKGIYKPSWPKSTVEVGGELLKQRIKTKCEEAGGNSDTVYNQAMSLIDEASKYDAMEMNYEEPNNYDTPQTDLTAKMVGSRIVVRTFQNNIQPVRVSETLF